MDSFKQISLLGLRLSLGWLMFYAGITKILNPEWSAEGFLKSANTFPDFYAWFAKPEILPYTNFLNEWGLTVVGALLVLGLGVRIASIIGIFLMALYYFPSLDFPYIGQSYIVDSHIIYIFGFLALIAYSSDQILSLGRRIIALPMLKNMPFLKGILE